MHLDTLLRRPSTFLTVCWTKTHVETMWSAGFRPELKAAPRVGREGTQDERRAYEAEGAQHDTKDVVRAVEAMQSADEVFLSLDDIHSPLRIWGSFSLCFIFQILFSLSLSLHRDVAELRKIMDSIRPCRMFYVDVLFLVCVMDKKGFMDFSSSTVRVLLLLLAEI